MKPSFFSICQISTYDASCIRYLFVHSSITVLNLVARICCCSV